MMPSWAYSSTPFVIAGVVFAGALMVAGWAAWRLVRLSHDPPSVKLTDKRYRELLELERRQNDER